MVRRFVAVFMFTAIIAAAAGASGEEQPPPAAARRCGAGYAFSEAKGECVACDAPCETGVPGICKRGIVDCSSGLAVCDSIIRSGERLEVCNGEDDNCDGRIDEGYDKDGDGYTTCGGDCDDRDPSVHPDAVERCDGKDNNCNGLADDGFNIGGACTAGNGECLREGRRRCAPSGLGVECDAKPLTPLKESCDGKDNDCNGQIDDGLGEVVCGVGACRRTMPACQGGRASICVPGEPSPELCGDGIDNDCDGGIDEGYPDVGQVCYAGAGACRRPGKILCNAERRATTCSAVSGDPGVEACGNALDDDCDGEVDTDTPGLGELCSNGLAGDCLREGRRICDSKTHQLVCSAQDVKPQTERCDGRDNDCDGVIDNGVVERTACGQGACAGGMKERRCDAGAWGDWGACSTSGKSSAELCGNGIDDDCDGVVDSDAPGLGDPCENDQVGSCQRNGRLVCKGAGGLVCSAERVDPLPEVCNGVDDDCDGAIDEGVTNACGGCGDLPGTLGSPCQVPGGDECAVGRWACAAGEKVGMVCALDAARSEGTPCARDMNPCTRDVCHLGACAHPAVTDGVSCDDGDLCSEGDRCIAGQCEAGGTRSCDDGNSCTAESCDRERGCLHAVVEGGVLNACGGCEILPAAPGQACAVEGRSGVCARGQWSCIPDGSVACVQALFPSAEACNGIDDDCDGEVDEGLGQATCGIGACLVTTENCNEGKAQSCVPRDPQPESCANMGNDDDCNGVVDDVAGLGQDCPAAFGTCILPGKKKCIGDATAPVCVPVDARAAEDDDGNGVVNYCDRGETIAGSVDAMGRVMGNGFEEGGGQRLYDFSRTRAVMLPWARALDAAVVASESPDRALLLVSGATADQGGIAALWAKDLSSGAAAFRSCPVPAPEAPQRLLVVGETGDVIASMPTGYMRYPKIASQIPSPQAGAYRCRLTGEALVSSASRSFAVKGEVQSCAVERVEALERRPERPLVVAGAVVCRLPSSFWKRQGWGFGLDLFSEDAAGRLVYEFLPVASSEGEVKDVHVVFLPQRDGGGLFATAAIAGKRVVGVCRKGKDGWECPQQVLEGEATPVAFAGFVGDAEHGAPLLLIAETGEATEVAIDSTSGAIVLLPAGAIPLGDDGAVSGGIPFPSQRGQPPMVLLQREKKVTVAAIQPQGVLSQDPGEKRPQGVVRLVPGEVIMPQATDDGVFPGERFDFGRPHALALLPLKSYGGRDVFSAFEILKNAAPVGEMGFFYWNMNDRPSGALADVQFNGKRGSARLAFSDPADDPLSYRAMIRAHHGGLLDDWIDGLEGGRLRFSVKGDPSSVGLWPVEIVVEASDPGGLTTTSKAVLRRDGAVEAITESAGSAP